MHRIAPVHRRHETVAYDDALADAPGEIVELPVGRCHVRRCGTGSPVLLVHGFLYSTYMWEPVIEQLAEHFEVIAVDLMGWGYSERNDRRDYGYELYAEQLRQLLDALELESVAIVGQSMGGGTAIRLAVDVPERVERLVLVDPSSLPNRLALAGRIFALPLVGELLIGLGGDEVVARNVEDLWFYDETRVTSEYLRGVVEPLRIEGSAWTILNILRTLDFGSQSEQVAQLGALDIPTLIVWGRYDRAVPLRIGERMHTMIPQSSLVVIDDAGHSPHEEKPAEFLRHVVPFLAGEGDDGGAADGDSRRD